MTLTVDRLYLFYFIYIYVYLKIKIKKMITIKKNKKLMRIRAQCR